MKLTKEDICTLVKTCRINGMPEESFVAGFDDFDGKYYPIEALDAYYKNCECKLFTHLTKAAGGIVFFLRFI